MKNSKTAHAMNSNTNGAVRMESMHKQTTAVYACSYEWMLIFNRYDWTGARKKRRKIKLSSWILNEKENSSDSKARHIFRAILSIQIFILHMQIHTFDNVKYTIQFIGNSNQHMAYRKCFECWGIKLSHCQFC